MPDSRSNKSNENRFDTESSFFTNRSKENVVFEPEMNWYIPTLPELLHVIGCLISYYVDILNPIEFWFL